MLKLEIENMKNIKKGILEIPIEKGIICFAGKNASGKSTLMSCLGKLVADYSLSSFVYSDNLLNSSITFTYKKNINTWKYSSKDCKWENIIPTGSSEIHFSGLYEGSLFYGTRFKESLKVDTILKKGLIKDNQLSNAPKFVRENLSFILHGDYEHYKKLKKIKTMEIAASHKLRNVPFFDDYDGTLVSQYRMSSGECLLISLLYFINNTVHKDAKMTERNEPSIMIIDELEVALHPVAIVRLLEFLDQIVTDNNITVILSSHSPEVIHKINPNNLYMLELLQDRTLKITNPCYPSYAIRSVYKHDGFDYVILVEDILAKYLLTNTLKKINAYNSCLINILPVGGWENVLKLQIELVQNHVFGIGTEIFSILDGDVFSNIPAEYTQLPKASLPVPSIEKMLTKVLKDQELDELKKELNDKYFQIESIDSIYSTCIKKDQLDGKPFYKLLISDLKKRRISEDLFIQDFSTMLEKYIDFSKFENELRRKLKIN